MLDVWEGEPDINAALLDYVSLGTAHIAGYSYDGKLRATQMLCAALAAHMRCMLPGNIAVAPATNVLWVRPGLAGAQLLRFLLTARYDIAADDALLRQAVAPNAMAPAPQGFDRLRRECPERRELAGSTVSGVDLDAEAVALVEAMGCRYVVHAP